MLLLLALNNTVQCQRGTAENCSETIKSAVRSKHIHCCHVSTPGGNSHGLGPAIAVPRGEAVLVFTVLAPALSQGLGGRATGISEL